MKKHFITFANTSFMSCERIVQQVHDLDIFDSVQGLTEYDIPDFIEKHKYFIEFISNLPQKRPYGLFIWKPKVILDALGKLENGDILVYADAGIYVNSKGKKRLDEYFDMLKTKDLVIFSLGDLYKAQNFVKGDAVIMYRPEFRNERTNMCYAGLLIMKKTDTVIRLLTDWLQLCEQYHFLDPSDSYMTRDRPGVSNDLDNGLFCLCVSKYTDSIHRVYPDEVNMYAPNGQQLAHFYGPDYNSLTLDWSSLDHVPFQVRRLTPKNGVIFSESQSEK